MSRKILNRGEERYAAALLAAQLLMARAAEEREPNEDRREKMERVIGIFRKDFDGIAHGRSKAEVLAEFSGSLDDSARIAFLVETHFLDPFSPYTLRRLRGQRREGVGAIATALGLDRALVSEIARATKSATRSHKRRSWASWRPATSPGRRYYADGRSTVLHGHGVDRSRCRRLR